MDAWLAEPHRLHDTLAVRGEAGADKTALLLELSVRMPDAVYVECCGLTADEVAHRLLTACGVTGRPESLAAGAQRINSGGVALLANVQWADQYVTSNEAKRITQRVTRTLQQFSRPDVRFVVERSADRGGAVPLPRHPRITR
ncbi:hypothetical protein [Streptomyces sp. V3I7]|uniref:hypothetical protein n=1 Tax=Streptomyces sp. V3I7 TaxID=3042278 RepID=UPI00278B5322|nr:hypothetical protein [Streptomyces sp. V3I7]MDQ0993406.1 hypothetical protein [Streptomyces sp. V3I7]